MKERVSFGESYGIMGTLGESLQANALQKSDGGCSCLKNIEKGFVKSMKKKVLIALLALTVAVSAMGCGSKKSDSEDSTKAKTESSSEDEEAVEEVETDSDGHVVAVDTDDISKYVTLGDYKNLSVTVTKTEVTDDSVSEYINQQLTYQPEEITEDRAVQENDTVNIDYTGYMDGEEFSGGSATDTDLLIGSGQFIDGFESGLIGAKKGDEVTLNLQFPDPYQNNPDLAGKDVQFKVKINKISQPAELTDEWVSNNTDVKTVDEYKAEIKESLEESAKMEYNNNKKSNLFSALANTTEISEYPDDLMEAEKATIEKRFEDSYAKPSGMTLDEYWESQSITDDQATQLIEYQAQLSLQQNMIVQAVLDAEGITFTKDEYREQLDKFAKEYGFEDAEALEQAYTDVELVKDNVLWSKVCDILEEYGTITDVAEDETTDATATDSNTAESSDSTETTTDGETQTAN